MIIDGGGGKGGGEGWLHALLAVFAMDSNDNRNGDCLSKKRGWTRKKERRKRKMGLFFSCCLILLLFFGLSFSMQVN